MPLDVAVEEPHAWVVGAEAQDDVALGSDEDGVAAHGRGREGGVIGSIVESCFFGAAVDRLEDVAVQVERVLSWVVIVEDDFDDLVMAEDELVRVRAVDCGVGCIRAGGKDGVEGWDFRTDVGLVVEEGAVRVSASECLATSSLRARLTSSHRHRGYPSSC